MTDTATTDGAPAPKRRRETTPVAPVIVTETALAAGDPAAQAAVDEALAYLGFNDYAALQAHLGYGSALSDGRPDTNSLVWLSLRSRLFEVGD